VVALALAAKASAEPIEISQKPDHVTEAVAIVNAPPSEVYILATDYRRWSSVFSDVASVKVEAGDRQRTRLRVKSRTFGQTLTLVFENVADRAIRFRSIEGPPGVRARGEYLLVPINGGTRTQVTARLYLDVVGAAGLFVSDRRLRSLRRASARRSEHDNAAGSRRAAHPELASSASRTHAGRF
jgi:uncharacterized membrane protein